MDKEKIEYLLTLNPNLPEDSYRDTIIALLTPPAWYRPLKRARFYRTLSTRVGLVMAEYAGDLLNGLFGGEDQTTYKPNPPVKTTTTPTPPRPAVSYKFTGPGSPDQ